jgi:hypothetical protein
MPYTPNPTNAAEPLDSEAAGTAAAEFRALKGRVNTLAGANTPRNKLHNGNFLVRQSITYSPGGPYGILGGVPPADNYLVDRWVFRHVGSGVASAQLLPIGSTTNKRLVFTGISTTSGLELLQRIEAVDCVDAVGKTATLSVDLANSLLTTVNWTLRRPNTIDTYAAFGASRTAIASGSFTVNSTVSRYSTQITIPASATTGLELQLSVGAQTSGTWTVGDVQLELGAVATPFEIRPIADEFIRCQRYTQTVNISVSGYSTAGTPIKFYMPFRTPMRVAPAYWETNLGTGINLAGASILDVGIYGAVLRLTPTVTGVVGVDGAALTFFSEL